MTHSTSHMTSSAMILLLTVLPILSTAADTNLVISGGSVVIRVRDEASGASVQAIPVGTDVFDMILTPDQSLLISGGSSHVINIWNYTTGVNIRSLSGHEATVYSLAISPDGAFLFSGDDARPAQLRVWNFESGAPVRNHSNTARGFFALAVSKDNQYYFGASGDAQNGVRQWSVNTGQIVRTLIAVETVGNFAMTTSTSGILFVCGSGDFKIRAFDVSTGASRGTMTGHTSDVNAMVLSADESTLYSASSDQTFKVWRTSDYTSVNSFGVSDQLFSVSLSNSTDAIYVGNNNGQVLRVSVTSGVTTQTLPHAGTVYALAHVHADPVPPSTTVPTTTAATGATTTAASGVTTTAATGATTTAATGATTTATTGATTTAATGATTTAATVATTTAATGVTTTAATGATTNATLPSSSAVLSGAISSIVIGLVFFFTNLL